MNTLVDFRIPGKEFFHDFRCDTLYAPGKSLRRRQCGIELAITCGNGIFGKLCVKAFKLRPLCKNLLNLAPPNHHAPFLGIVSKQV